MLFLFFLCLSFQRLNSLFQRLSLSFLFPFVLWCADALESRSILLDNAKLASFWLTANKSTVFYFFSCFFWQLRNKVITLQKI